MKSLPTLLAGALSHLLSANNGLHDDQRRDVQDTIVELRERGALIDKAFEEAGDDSPRPGTTAFAVFSSGLYGFDGSATVTADAGGVYGYGTAADLTDPPPAPAPVPAQDSTFSAGSPDVQVSGEGDGAQITDAQADALDRDGDGNAGGSLPDGYALNGDDGTIWTTDGTALLEFAAPNAFVFRAIQEAALLGEDVLFHDAGPVENGKRPDEFEATDFEFHDSVAAVIYDADSVAIIHRPPSDTAAAAQEGGQDGQVGDQAPDTAADASTASTAPESGADAPTTDDAADKPKKPKK